MKHPHRTLYTFGCSFTEYPWPTWADIIGYDYDRFENWGLGGSGNEHALLSLIEVLNTRPMSPYDKIMICWSTLPRIDIRRGGLWEGYGNILNTTMSKTVINELYNEEGFAYKSIQYVLAACKLLSKINVQWKFFFMSDFFDEDHEGYKNQGYLKTYFHEQLAQYGDHITMTPMWKTLLTEPKKKYTVTGPTGYAAHEDYHLTPKAHMKFIDMYMPEIQLSTNARQFAVEADNFVMNENITYHELIQDWSKKSDWKLRSKPKNRL